LNRTVWTNNKAYKSGMAESANCEYCAEIETMEHLIYGCENYSALVWNELSAVATEYTRQAVGHDVARIALTPREIIFNAQHPSIKHHLAMHSGQHTLQMLVQEIKREIIYRRMNIRPAQRGRVAPMVKVQACIISTIQKMISLQEYQGPQRNAESLVNLKQLQEIARTRVR
jgi:hypothetical protein